MLRLTHSLPVLGIATVLVLAADAVHPSLTVQAVLGGVAWTVLLIAGIESTPAERRALLACVCIATLVELFGSVAWGVYRYTLYNVPQYVPPGHGLVYYMALRLSATRVFTRAPHLTVRIAVSVAVAWTAFGLLISPWLLHRTDVLGAFWCVYFVCFSLRTSRGVFFAAVLAVTSALELLGTGLGTWTWQVTDPLFGIGSGNPPAAVAGGYCVIEAAVVVASRRRTRVARHSHGISVPAP